MNKGATFSEDREYRYLLWRIWDERKPYALFIGLNPSTAGENRDDPTIRRCMSFAGTWGYGGLYMANLFGFVTTNPKMLDYLSFINRDPVGPDNDGYLIPCALMAGVVVVAWGNEGDRLGRDKELLRQLPIVHHLGLTQGGHPRHPLYLKSDVVPQEFQHTPILGGD